MTNYNLIAEDRIAFANAKLYGRIAFMGPEELWAEQAAACANRKLEAAGAIAAQGLAAEAVSADDAASQAQAEVFSFPGQEATGEHAA